MDWSYHNSPQCNYAMHHAFQNHGDLIHIKKGGKTNFKIVQNFENGVKSPFHVVDIAKDYTSKLWFTCKKLRYALIIRIIYYE